MTSRYKFVITTLPTASPITSNQMLYQDNDNIIDNLEDDVLTEKEDDVK